MATLRPKLLMKAMAGLAGVRWFVDLRKRVNMVSCLLVNLITREGPINETTW